MWAPSRQTTFGWISHRVVCVSIETWINKKQTTQSFLILFSYKKREQERAQRILVSRWFFSESLSTINPFDVVATAEALNLLAFKRYNSKRLIKHQWIFIDMNHLKLSRMRHCAHAEIKIKMGKAPCERITRLNVKKKRNQFKWIKWMVSRIWVMCKHNWNW